MPRKLIITGNGLGMAINPESFSLRSAITHVWNQDGAISNAHKGIISTCVGNGEAIEAPNGEDELDRLHRVVAACELLGNIYPENNPEILTEAGVELPNVLAMFIHKVAAYLFEQGRDNNLPDEFLNPLLTHLRAEKSHVATLNYDCLLYRPFIEENICRGYDGELVDGIHNNGFDPDHLERMGKRDFGWYLHLHGSPLFYDEDGEIKKFNINAIDNDDNEVGRHLVLTHVNHKRSVIDQSQILNAYWDKLSICLEEASEVLLFGYSGCDIHLNQKIKPYLRNTPIRIIEWSGSGERDRQVKYWQNLFPQINEDNYVYLDNILEFTQW